MSSTSQTRLHVLALISLGILLLLVGRLWIVQLTPWWRAWAARQAAGNRTSITYAPAPRGLIFDRNRQILAANRPVWNVAIVPGKFPETQDQMEKIIARLAGILQVPSPQLRREVKAAAAKRGRELVLLGDDLGVDVKFPVVAKIEEQAFPGVIITESSMRSYPRGPLAAHVLGYARAINEVQYHNVADLTYPDELCPRSAGLSNPILPRDPLYSRDDTYGQAGLEKRYDEAYLLDFAPPTPVLTGRRGRTVYEVDAVQVPVRLIEYRPPAVGATLTLTLDVRVQEATEKALWERVRRERRRTGAAVVMDVEDGGIIAMVSLPAFNPNDWVKRMPAKLWQQLNNDPRTPLLNKATRGQYPPASTFKLISMTAALDLLKATPNTRYTCTGKIREGDRTFKCWKPQGHGTLDFRNALANSCDVYFYELIRQSGVAASDIHRYATEQFGLGEITGLDLPEEVGLVPRGKVRGSEWRTGNSLNMVIGQGSTLTTPLQMARVCAAVANGGYLLQPHLVKSITWPEHFGFSGPTRFIRHVDKTLEVRPETLQVVREGMRLAVTNGTGRSLSNLGVSVAGKTGSAEHLRDRPPHSWFVCFAPYDRPKYAIAVFVGEGGHGSDTALPIAREILAALFNLKASTTGPVVPYQSD